jgi:hypothetical protein
MAKRKKDESKGHSSPELTPAELAGLDFLIKDMEERGERRLDVGFLPGIIVTFLVRAAVRWLVERLFVYIILRAIIGATPGQGGLSDAQMREAEKLLGTAPSPSLADLKKVRDLVKTKKSE